MTEGFEPQAFLEDFITEAAEHLSAMDDLLLEAERLTAAGQGLDQALVNGLFRSVHTVKGMAGMMDFDGMTRLAHAMEQIFDEVRQGSRQLAPADWGALFVALDLLKGLLSAIREDGSEGGRSVESALAALAAVGDDAEPRPGASWLERLDPHDQMAVLVEVAKGAHLLQLQVAPERHCPDGFASWHADLGLFGRVLGVWSSEGAPLSPEAAEGREALAVLFLTEADAASVLDGTGLPPEAVAPAPLPWKKAAEAAPATAERPAEEAPARETPARATSIRVETARLDHLMELVGELVIHQTRLSQLSLELSEVLEAPGSLDGRRARLGELVGSLEEAMQTMARASDDLQASTMRVRMMPVSALFNRFPRIVRDLAHECGKAARLVMVGQDTELDKTVIEQLGDPLIHLLRNALDHGLEPADARRQAGKPEEGTITLSAAQQGHHIVITVADDGRGIDRARVLAKARESGLVAEGEALTDAEIFALIFKPGFSTAAAVTNLSGRGVGMDVVQQNIQKLGGAVQVLSEPGRGTRFVVKLPLTLAIAKALLVRSSGHTFAIPLASVEETLRLKPEEIRTMQHRELIQVRGSVMPVFRLAELFGYGRPESEAVHLPTVIVGDGEQRLGLLVDAMVGQQDVVVKSLGDFLGQPPGVGGATILGDGRVALILDIPTLLRRHAVPATSLVN